jgi:HSP20 family molecular chaperone IbpA
MLMPRRNFDLFDDIFDEPMFGRNDNKIMKTDIKEHDNGYEIIVDLPGYNKNNLHISIEDGYLTVNAKQEKEHNDKDNHGKFVRRERFFGECSRSFYVGEDIKEEDIKASYKDGVLTIDVPKVDQSKKIPEKKYIQIEG